MVVLNQAQIVKIGSRYHLPVELFLLPMFLKTITMKEKKCDSKFFIATGLNRYKLTQRQLVSRSQAWWHTLLIPAVQGQRRQRQVVQGQTNLQSYFWDNLGCYSGSKKPKANQNKQQFTTASHF